MPFRRQMLDESGAASVRGSLNGSVIVSELLRNMEVGRFVMAYTVLLPCVFTVYLNPADHAALSGVFDFVIEDARKALRARVAEWNRGSVGPGKRRRQAAKEYKIACREWQLEFLPENEVPPGDVEIHSQLNETVRPGFRGTRTTLLGGDPSITREVPAGRAVAAAEPVYAAIHFEDESGPQTFLVRQNQVRIGRGGEGQPVDLALRASDEISRQHLVIRRDPATGRFSAFDTSTNGTSVNGKRLAKGAECPLGPRTRIQLGDEFDLLFEVAELTLE